MHPDDNQCEIHPPRCHGQLETDQFTAEGRRIAIERRPKAGQLIRLERHATPHIMVGLATRPCSWPARGDERAKDSEVRGELESPRTFCTTRVENASWRT